MLVRRIMLRCVLAGIVFFAQSAQAFFDPPWITPENPVADRMISVNVYGGKCDWIAGRDGYPQITQQGNAVRILEYGAHYEEGSELCIDGVGTVTRQIGSFPAGDYTLTVDLVYEDQFTGRPEILNIGVVLFTVSAPSEPVSVPAGSSLGMGLLLVALLAVAILVLKKAFFNSFHRVSGQLSILRPRAGCANHRGSAVECIRCADARPSRRLGPQLSAFLNTAIASFQYEGSTAGEPPDSRSRHR